MTELVKRKSIPELFAIKVSLLQKLEDLDKIDRDIDKTFEEINGYEPYRIDYRFGNYADNRTEKYIDRTCYPSISFKIFKSCSFFPVRTL